MSHSVMIWAVEAGESAHALSGWWLLVSAVLIVFNAFFVAVEFALVGSRRVKLESMVEVGNKRAATALEQLGDLQTQLAGAQLGITLVALVLGIVGEPVVAQYVERFLGNYVSLPSGIIHTIAFAIALTFVVFNHMVLGEMVPKNLALVEPERALLWLAPINRVYMWLFMPVIWFVNVISNVAVRALGFELTDEIATVHTAEEFGKLVDASHLEGQLEEFEHTLLSGALDFGERHVSAVMVPRSKVVSVKRTMTVAEIEQVVVESGHSRLLVVGATIDESIGVVHAKDLLLLPPESLDEVLPLELVRNVMYVAHGRPLDEVMVRMRSDRRHFGVVRGPKGSTLGIVTLEDILEELVGEIEDETDVAEPV